MSGVEVVGLILGLYPVIVSLAETYKNRSGSTWLSNKVLIASTVYEQTVISLLGSAVPDDEVQQLMRTAGESQDNEQALWENPGLKEALCSRLGPRKFKAALEYLTEIKTQLDIVKTDLDNMCRGTEVLDRFKARVRTTFAGLPQSRIQDRVKRINGLNEDLRRLLDDRPIITPLQHRRPSVTPPMTALSAAYENNSQDAHDFYKAVQEAYTCHCKMAHLTSLGCHCAACIQVFAPSITSPTHEWEFGLVIPKRPDSPSDGPTAVLLEPASAEDVTASTIGDLCSLFNEFTDAPLNESDAEVRDIVSSDKKRYKMRIRKVIAAKSDSKTDNKAEGKTGNNTEAVKDSSTDVETDNNAEGKSHIIRRFADLMQPDSGLSTRSRRELAIRLSAAIIRLRKTPWVDGSWTWNDVWVGQDVDTTSDITKFSILFIPREFYSVSHSDDMASIVTAVSQPALSQIMDDEPVLTKLGFALIELAMGKTIQEMREGYDSDNGWGESGWIDNDMANIIMVKSLLKGNKIREQAGRQYEDVVKACILHEYFDLDGNPRGLKLEHDSFPRSVQDAIISPLYGVWQDYGGGIASPV